MFLFIFWEYQSNAAALLISSSWLKTNATQIQNVMALCIPIKRKVHNLRFSVLSEGLLESRHSWPFQDLDHPKSRWKDIQLSAYENFRRNYSIVRYRFCVSLTETLTSSAPPTAHCLPEWTPAWTIPDPLNVLHRDAKRCLRRRTSALERIPALDLSNANPKGGTERDPYK